MLLNMREVLEPIFSCVSVLKTQLRAAIAIPLTDANQLGEHENRTTDSTPSWPVERLAEKSFRCVDDRPGNLTGNGLGSLEIGAAHDD